VQAHWPALRVVQQAIKLPSLPSLCCYSRHAVNAMRWPSPFWARALVCNREGHTEHRPERWLPDWGVSAGLSGVVCLAWVAVSVRQAVASRAVLQWISFDRNLGQCRGWQLLLPSRAEERQPMQSVLISRLSKGCLSCIQMGTAWPQAWERFYFPANA